MNEIRVKKDELLERLKANRDQHRAIFLDAQKGYRDAVIKELDQMLEDARIGNKIRRSVSLVEPKDFTNEFDNAIAMLEWEIEDEVLLDQRDFARFVRNDWEWREQFRHSNAAYTALVVE